MVNWFKRGKIAPPAEDERAYTGSGYITEARKWSNMDSEVDDDQ